jgi:putative ABC transport system permease protein
MTGQAAVIISHALWLRRFGGDPGVVGRRVELNGAGARIVGVMDSGFRFDESPWGTAECWLPMVESRMMIQRRFRQFMAVGRLNPDVGLDAAQAELSAIAAALAKEHPKEDGGWGVHVEPLQDSLVGDTRPTMLILFGGVACVLLIACANIANLLFVRAAGRTREVLIRMAIGAGRSRLVRQWLTESTLLALAGGLAGFAVAIWAVPALLELAPLGLPWVDRIAVDARVFAFCAGLSLLTGFICGVAPALGIRGMAAASLRSAGATAAPSGRRWLRPSLVAGQVGIAIVLLVGAGLLGRTLLAVHGLDLGFNPRNVLTFVVDLRGGGYQSLDAARAFGRDLTGRLQAMPAVQAAGVGGVPLQGIIGNSFLVEGRDNEVSAKMNVASAGYFPGLGLRLRSGRFFTDQDDERGQRVAIVDRGFAREAWGGEEVIGRRLRASATTPWMTVVGVVDDMRSSKLEASPPPMVFLPYRQSTIATDVSYLVRTSGDPSDAIPLVRDAVRALDPKLAVTRLATLEELIATAVAPRLFNVWLVGLFSLLALVLAAVGIYGLINETVSSRTPEIGVRVALGASRPQVVRLVVGGTLVVTATGMVGGLAAAALLTRSLESMLFGVEPVDPLTLIVMPTVFFAIAILAALVPALRATRVDPVLALRGE